MESLRRKLVIHTLDKLAVENKTEIMQWIADKYNIIPPPLFSSVDIRNAEFKVAHVDTNLFPAGFNNLSAKSIELAAQNFRGYFKSHLPNKGKVLLIPENFTRNLRYLENIVTIREIIVQSGLEVAIGSPFIEETMELVHPEVFKGCES
jgi:glutamate--cysteine ligase